jgi:branched-chain amino acid transport system permease protein
VSDALLFGILGLTAGSAYALTGLGITLTYKGSGVVNLAQGAQLMIAAFAFTQLTTHGMGIWPAAAVVLAGGGVVGALIYVVVMRPLRTAPLLAKTIATIGLLIALSGAATLIWGNLDGQQTAPALFGSQSVHAFGIVFGVANVYLTAVVALFTTALWAVYRFTRFGLATRAAADNETAASYLGLSPDSLATCNWALGSVLAAAAGVMLASISVLDVTSLTFVVLPAIAAAMVGRFSSFGVTALVGLVIGIVQSELTLYWNAQGVITAFPFVIVFVAMLFSGRLIPERGQVGDRRLPFSLSGKIERHWVVALPVVVLVLLAVVSGPYQAAIITSMIVAILALAVVIVTGYVGQISLAPMTLAGFGAFAASKFAEHLGVPFPVPILLGAVVAAPIGVIIGLPSLRVRGVSLAVVTLGAAIAVDAVLFQNQSLTGGARGSLVPTPSIGGFSLNSVTHPVRYGIFVLVVLGAVSLAVSTLRRNPLGRRMLAVRGNERAAAAAGISVPVVKLQAFALSAAVAGLGGGVLAYQIGSVSFAEFVPLESLALVSLVYIGGVASVTGALQAGLLATGGVMYVLLNQIGALDKYWITLTGVLLVATIVTQPDGIAVANSRLLHRVLGRRRSTPRSEEVHVALMDEAQRDETSPPAAGSGAVV